MNLRVKELCKQRGFTMSDLAAKMGVNQGNLTSSLKGNPTLSRLESVAEVLGVDITELFSNPADSANSVQGYLECRDGIHKVNNVDDLLCAETYISGLVNVPVYYDLKNLRKQVKYFIHNCVKKVDGVAFIAGRIDHRELFHLSWDFDAQQFLLTLLSKNVIYVYYMLEYGQPDEGYDIDGPMGLVETLVSDLEFSLESSDEII